MRNLGFTTIALLMFGLIWSPVFLGCGANTSNQRTTTLTTTYTGMKALHASWVAWDEAHQDAIIANAPNYAAGQAALIAYRDKQAKFKDSFITAYSVIAAALTVNDDPSLQAALKSFADLKVAYDAFKAAEGGQ